MNNNSKVIVNDNLIDIKDIDESLSIIIADDVKFGDNVRVEYGVKIGSGSIIGDNVFIDKDSKIGDNTKIGNDCVIEDGVTIGNNVTISNGQTVGQEAIVDDNTVLENTFYIKTAKSNITYCGNNKASIGCQLFPLDFWFSNYKEIALQFDYTEEEVQECLEYMNYIKDNI